MARPLRIETAGGWYHVTSRGNQRQAIFVDDRYRRHLLELLETPAPNLSQAMHWLQLSYSTWFNRRHQRSGHFFQRRYKSILIKSEGVGWEVSQYVHLNPVRIRKLGLDKAGQQRSRQGMGVGPSREQVQRRLKLLRNYRWSSYRAYTGLVTTRRWLTTRTVLRLGGGRSWEERRRKYRQQTEQLIREGIPISPWERLQEQVLPGSAGFVTRTKKQLSGDEREQPQLKRLRGGPGWEAIVEAVKAEKGERWEAFRDRYADWGRDLALYVARRRCGLRLRELAGLVGGIDYGSVTVAISRFGKRLDKDKTLRQIVQRIERKLLK